MPRKCTYEFVKQSFEKEGYKLLSDVYRNNKDKLNYLCPLGHKHIISFHEWKDLGNRCPYCSRKIKKTISEIKMLFDDEGYTLLTKEYKNASTYLDYVCPNGHVHTIRWYNWQIGHRCPFCVGQIKPTLIEIDKSFSNEGYVLLSNEYKTNRTLLKYRCSKGHYHKISWLKWKQGRRCRECSILNKTGLNSCNWKGGISCEPYCEVWLDKEYKKSILERDGYKCLNPYCSGMYSNKLVIHHIDFNKKNCIPSNLITICNSCNGKANYDREWHIYWYRAILNKRYNYKN